jgi:hypothetical protein
MLSYSKSKIIAYLVKKIDEIKINDFNLASTINRCETCVLIKAHEITSRKIETRKIDRLLVESRRLRFYFDE